MTRWTGVVGVVCSVIAVVPAHAQQTTGGPAAPALGGAPDGTRTGAVSGRSDAQPLVLPAVSFAPLPSGEVEATGLSVVGGLAPVGGLAGAVPGETRFNPNPALPLPSEALGTGVIPAGAAGVPLGPMYLYPTLGVSFGYNDNPSGTSGGGSSTFWGLSPRLVAGGNTGTVSYALGYAGDIVRYADTPDYDFDTHQFTASASSALNARTDVRGLTYFMLGADTNGSVDREVFETQRWRGLGALGTIGYGAAGATGRVEFDLGVTDKSYDDADVAATQDVTTLTAVGRFLYRVAPRTQLLTELGYTGFDYADAAASTRDSAETSFRVGALWNITAITSGSVRIGVINKQFDNPAIDDYTGPDFALALNWMPRTYSTVGLFANARPVDSTGFGDYKLSRVIGGNWTHTWTSQIASRAFLSYRMEEYEGVGVSREDDTTAIGLGLVYTMRRWMRFGAQWVNEDRDSTDSDFTFRRNVYSLTAGFSL